jgi:hypothetical protein
MSENWLTASQSPRRDVITRPAAKSSGFQQTMKKWLATQPDRPATIAQLQALLDGFVEECNHRRPHRSLEHRATPATVYTSLPQGHPRRPRRRLPRPGPPRPRRQGRQDHPALPRPALLHRHRANPRPNPPHRPRPGPRHPRRRRRHRRAAPRARPRPIQELPRHRTTTRPQPLRQRTAEPTTIAFGRPGCPETSQQCPRQDSNLRSRLRSAHLPPAATSRIRASLPAPGRASGPRAENGP